MAERQESDFERIRRRGRRAGILVFALLVGGFTVVCSIQIIVQVWDLGGSGAVAPGIGCREGVSDLLTAIRRARRGAAAETGGEHAALQRFRQALGPEWQLRPALDEHCAQDPAAQRALKAIDRVRYAEEHAVRYESADLARRRRDLRRVEQELLQSSAPPRVE
ncbi:MAG TPA: hypothetical protein VKZ49_16085 [Polyangiaceae bacterium]|nr:hypothetical protein [Polyangiaceae bacterium]